MADLQPILANKNTSHQVSYLAMNADAASSRRQQFQYIAAAMLGGYAFTWGFIALGVASLFALGMEFHDAENLASILGFLVFLTVFLWAFTARSLRRIWLTLAGGGALMAGAASLIQLALIRSL